MPERRFPPPWTIEDLGSSFVVKDRSELLSKDEAANIERPELLQ